MVVVQVGGRELRYCARVESAGSFRSCTKILLASISSLAPEVVES